MLISEARDPEYIKNLATKQDVIDRRKSDLNKADTIKKAAETLWSSDEDYDYFLNCLVDL